MIDAAPRAASSAAGVRWGAAASSIAAVTSALREVCAAQTAVPHACCGVRAAAASIRPRLSRRSRAYPGSRSFRRSMAVVVMLTPFIAASGRAERRLALVPVARAQLVGLQRIEHAQHLGRVATDGQIVDRREPDHALGIDDEGRTQRDALPLVEHAERLR